MPKDKPSSVSSAADTSNNLSKDKAVVKDSKELSLFKKHFSARLQAVAQVRKSHQHISRKFRRLDSLARLLEGSAICAAVHYHVPTKTIWLANNKVHTGSHATNEQIRFMQLVFSLISNEDLTLKDICEHLANVICLNICQEKRFGVSQLKDEKDEKIDLKKLIGEWVEQLFKFKDGTKAWREQASEDLDYAKGATRNTLLKCIKITSRLVRDFLKLRKFLLSSTGSKKGLAHNIASAIRAKRFKILHVEDKDVHAEIRIVAKMLQSAAHADDYIGISKLCCAHCSLALDAFGKQSRGLHGQAAKWPIATFITDDAKNLKKYVGDKAYQNYKTLPAAEKKAAKEYVASKSSSPIKENAKQGRVMSADSSDSDVELGFDSSSGEDSEIKQCALEDIWQLRYIKTHHQQEYDGLRKIGLSSNEIVALYKEEHAHDKFNAFASKKVYELILKLVKTEDENSYEIFIKLSKIYDDENDLFWKIIHDPKELAIEHGLDEVCDKYRAKAKEHDGYHSDGEEVDVYAQVANELEDSDGWWYASPDEDKNEDTNDSAAELADEFAELVVSPSNSPRNSH